MHTEKSHAAVTAWIETNAIVFDGEDEVLILLLNHNANTPGMGVLDAIVERFLDNAIDAGAMVFGEIIGKFVVDDIDDEASTFGNFATLPLEGSDEAEVVEHGGAEEESHVADFVDALFGKKLDALQAGGQGGGGRRGVGEVLQVHQESGEGLADLVVEFAGDGAALLFLGIDEALREFLEFVLRAQGLFVFFAGVTLEANEINDGGGGEEEAEGEGGNRDDADAMAGIGEDAGDLGFGLTEIELVQFADFTGEGENGSALGEGEVAQGEAVGLGGIHEEDAVSEEPVGSQFVAEILEGGVLVAGKGAKAGFEGVVRVIAEVVKLREVGLAGGGVGFGERVFAKEVAGFVEAEADIAEGAFALEVILADGGAGGFQLIEGVDGIEGKKSHESKKGAEAEEHSGERTNAASSGRDVGGERRLRIGHALV